MALSIAVINAGAVLQEEKRQAAAGCSSDNVLRALSSQSSEAASFVSFSRSIPRYHDCDCACCWRDASACVSLIFLFPPSLFVYIPFSFQQKRKKKKKTTSSIAAFVRNDLNFGEKDY